MGRPCPDHLHGRGLPPVLRDEADLDRDVVVEWNGPYTGARGWLRGNTTRPRVHPEFVEARGGMAGEAEILDALTTPVRTVLTPDGWKLSARRGDADELFDLDDDPRETRNPAADPGTPT